ncbi:MAG: binding-protein-dependent transport system, secreted component [Thermoleophilia bacterium]|nr:binding-protein-dependent transport system, secreted component [Thermoleophilia bacterium]
MRRAGMVRAAACTALVLVASLLAAACGGGSSGSDGAAKVVLHAPKELTKRGTLVLCSDIGYPPAEFMGEDGKPAGADIDIGTALAKRLGVKVKFANTGFDGILDALAAEKCDAVISALTDNAERRKAVTFVDYLKVGQSLLVPTANEHDIAGLDDLDGLTVAVQEGTTNATFLQGEVKTRDWGTEGPPTVKTFAKDEDAAKALAAGTADAYFGDSPTAAYYIGQEALTYAFAGKPINAEPIGIAVRPGDPLAKQLQRGVDAMYDDGSMRRILKRWKLEDFALHR